MNPSTLFHKLWNYCNVLRDVAGFQFAHAPLIAGLMAELERGMLRRHTPCREANDSDVARALAEVHAELILVHPFREGNGRLARLLALLMALQVGLPPLDFSPLSGCGKRAYIAGIHAALSRDYLPLAAMFARVMARSRRRAASNSDEVVGAGRRVGALAPDEGRANAFDRGRRLRRDAQRRLPGDRRFKVRVNLLEGHTTNGTLVTSDWKP